MHRLSLPLRWFFAGFNWVFDRLAIGYSALTARLVRLSFILLVIYAGLIYFAIDLLQQNAHRPDPTI